jgi:hypothetical protein
MFRKSPKASPTHIGVEALVFLKPSAFRNYFTFFLVKSVTLAFKGVDAKGGRLDLVTIENMMADLAKPEPGRWNGHQAFF